MSTDTPTMKRDYYETLGVEKGANPEALKKAFRKLAMDCHPDRNPGDKSAEQKFKELNEAYDVLKDEQKRAAYDRFGHAAFENGGMGRGGGQGFAGGGFDFTDIFDEMFGEFMGGGRRGQAARGRGADLRYNMEISLEEAFHGKQATIRVPTSVACESCNGSGGEKGAQPITCPACHGYGKVRATQGFFTIERTCAACHGAGKVIEKACKTCKGAGRTAKEKTLQVAIPAGV
jgi:molecular chaperone DnaJ